MKRAERREEHADGERRSGGEIGERRERREERREKREERREKREGRREKRERREERREKREEKRNGRRKGKGGPGESHGLKFCPPSIPLPRVRRPMGGL